MVLIHGLSLDPSPYIHPTMPYHMKEISYLHNVSAVVIWILFGGDQKF